MWLEKFYKPENALDKQVPLLKGRYIDPPRIKKTWKKSTIESDDTFFPYRLGFLNQSTGTKYISSGQVTPVSSWPVGQCGSVP